MKLAPSMILVGIYAQMFNNDFLDALCGIAHVGTSTCVFVALPWLAACRIVISYKMPAKLRAMPPGQPSCGYSSRNRSATFLQMSQFSLGALSWLLEQGKAPFPYQRPVLRDFLYHKAGHKDFKSWPCRHLHARSGRSHRPPRRLQDRPRQQQYRRRPPCASWEYCP